MLSYEYNKSSQASAALEICTIPVGACHWLKTNSIQHPNLQASPSAPEDIHDSKLDLKLKSQPIWNINCLVKQLLSKHEFWSYYRFLNVFDSPSCSQSRAARIFEQSCSRARSGSLHWTWTGTNIKRVGRCGGPFFSVFFVFSIFMCISNVTFTII